MKKILLILLTLLTAVSYSQNWVVPGDTVIARNIKLTAFPSSTNGSRSLRVDNNGAVVLDTLAYSDIPVISSFIDKSRTCNSSRDDKDAFVTALASTNKLIIDDGCYYINSTLTIPTGKTLIFEPGGMIAGTGTIIGDETEIQAGLSQIFDTTLTLSGFKVKEAYPQWFGAKSDSATELSISLNKTIETFNTIVIPDGNYVNNSPIYIKRNSIIIRGNGNTHIWQNTDSDCFRFEAGKFNLKDIIIHLNNKNWNNSNSWAITYIPSDYNSSDITWSRYWNRLKSLIDNVTVIGERDYGSSMSGRGNALRVIGDTINMGWIYQTDVTNSYFGWLDTAILILPVDDISSGATAWVNGIGFTNIGIDVCNNGIILPSENGGGHRFYNVQVQVADSCHRILEVRNNNNIFDIYPYDIVAYNIDNKDSLFVFGSTAHYTKCLWDRNNVAYKDYMTFERNDIKFQNNIYPLKMYNTGTIDSLVIVGHGSFINFNYNLNAFVGFDAAEYGLYSSAFGERSLSSQTNTMNGNTAIGYSSLKLLSTGDYNTAIGKFAGGYKTSGNNNVYIGNSAGMVSGSGSNQIFIGNSTGKYETSDYTFMISYLTTGNQSNDRDSAFMLGTMYGDRALKLNTSVTVRDGLFTNYSAHTADYTATNDDNTLYFDCSIGSITLTLPDPTTNPGIVIYVKLTNNGGSNTLTIQPISGSIDGSSNKILSITNESAIIKSDGSNYWIF